MKHFLLIIIVAVAVSSCVPKDSNVVLQSINFTPDTIKIAAGTNLQLQPVFKPSVFSVIPVDWSSADATIATVSPTGIVNTTTPGSVWIYIKDHNSATTGKCLVIVQ